MLSLVVTPFASVLLAMSLLTERGEEGAIDLSLGFLIHILKSILTYSIFTLTAFQALLLTGIERWLKTHETNFLPRILPALETVENSICLVLWLGICCLSLTVLPGVVVLWSQFGALNNLLHFLFAMTSFSIFSVFLAGYFGLNPIIDTLSEF